jgi:BON domain-containing protein
MPNRYERSHDDDYGTGRRDDRDPGSYREDDEYRFGQRSDARPGRPPERQSYYPRPQRNEPEYRGAGSAGREYANRGNYPAREGYSERDPRFGNDNRFGGEGRFGGENRFGNYERSPQQEPYDAERFGEARAPYRGAYQEQGWARDPSSGTSYGYENTTRVGPRNPGAEGAERWRSNLDSSTQRGIGARGYNASSVDAARNLSGHYGKGPKGYVRSDERIREDVSDRLSDDDEVDASDITVIVKSGEVVLEGTVSDRHSKHRAEDIAESVSGVREVTNHLRAKKNLLQELGDKLTGDDDAQHHGHSGSGTRNSPSGTAVKNQSH